jgi:hypothetical protein
MFQWNTLPQEDQTVAGRTAVAVDGESRRWRRMSAIRCPPTVAPSVGPSPAGSAPAPSASLSWW